MKNIVQEAPFAVQVELALGCNLSCTFCGINGIGYGHLQKGLKLMTVQTAEKVAKQIADAGWNSRIEFARRGEPSLNPQRAEIIAVFRKHLPKHSIMMTSNGAGYLKGGPEQVANNVKVMFDAGLNLLALDDYDGAHIVEKIRAAVRKLSKKERYFQVFEYPKVLESNPHKRRHYTDKHLVYIQDIMSAEAGTHARVNNHGGYGPAPLDMSYRQPCAKPFREMSVDYNGRVPYCCINWGGEGITGDLTKDDLEKVWNGARFHAVRQKLLRGERDFGACKGCDHPSYRVGLLPDKYGKQRKKYPKPDSKTERIIDAMMKEGYQEKPIKLYMLKKAEAKS